MKHDHSLVRLTLLSITASLTLTSGAFGAVITFSEGGDATPGSILDTVNAFRSALGDPNNGNAPGPLASGRREINWDGGGSSATSPSLSPFDGFLNNRGARFTTPGFGFVQAPPTGLDTAFNNPNLSSTFGVFSQLRLFTPVLSNITDVFFFIPGTNGAVPAMVSGFGAVFTDVDLNGSTKIQFFDSTDTLIFDGIVPAGTVSDQSLSFFGAIGNAGEQISRVRITSGNTAIGPNFENPNVETVDVVAMDDFIYSEPVPEPRVFGMVVAGIVMMAWRRRKAFKLGVPFSRA